MNIVDTVLLDNNEVMHYLLSDTNGVLSLKPKGFHNLKTVHEQFMKIYRSLQGEGAKNIAVGYEYESSIPIVLQLETFEALCFPSTDHSHPEDLQVLL